MSLDDILDEIKEHLESSKDLSEGIKDDAPSPDIDDIIKSLDKIADLLDIDLEE